MRKKLNITWDGVFDSTGYMFLSAKALCCAVKHSLFSEMGEDTVAASGFAFRMWVQPDLCPSAGSIWRVRTRGRHAPGIRSIFWVLMGR